VHHQAKRDLWLVQAKAQLRHLAPRQLEPRKRVKVLTDQHVSPTLNTNLAGMVLEAAERKITGTLHTAEATSQWHEFALTLAEVFNLCRDLIEPATTEKMSWIGRRPKDSPLNVNRAMTLLNQKPLELDLAFEVMKKEAIQHELNA